MLARCLSASLQGLEARPVVVEVDLAPGLPGVQLVGLPDKAIQESRERVRSALRNSGFRGPLVRVVINLAPADLRKEGPSFDLPISLALLVASGHHLLLVGPPGCGKTRLAHQLPRLLPALSRKEALSITRIHSVAGQLHGIDQLQQQRPFRSPHHSCSAAALLGGGRSPRPGEVSLAHGGVLFLDELAEFPRAVLDQLRQPLEDGAVQISRSQQSTVFPALVTLVAATNPCPCGWHGDRDHGCRCSISQRQRCWQRLSGPLLDRLDLHCGWNGAPPRRWQRC